MDAPVLAKLERCLDKTAAERMLPGKTRATTVKRYVSYYRQWRQWLQEAKSVSMPGTEADLIDYLMARWEEPCGRTIPEVILKAVAWMERVAEFPEGSRTSTGRAVWAVKDRIVEALSIDAPVTKRAPRYPVFLLANIERYVMDESEPAIWRVLAWAKLVKVWACLRWDDLQSIKPAELRYSDSRLTTVLRKTKTSGPNRRVKELPVCVSERAFFVDSRWLGWGFDALRALAQFDRDYLIPQLDAEGDRFIRKMAGYGHAVSYTAGVLARVGCDSGFIGFWTEHSERAVLPTGLSMLDNDKAERDLLGRWKPEGSDVYARTFNGRVAKLQRQFAEACRQDDHYEVLDEREIPVQLGEFLSDRRKSEASAISLATRQGLIWKRPIGKVVHDYIPLLHEEEDPELGAGVGSESEASGSEDSVSQGKGKPPKVAKRSSRYVVVCLKGDVFRLHKAGVNGCWMGRQRAFKEAIEFGEKPAATEYTHVCKLCWPGSAEAEGASDSEGSSAETEDGGTPRASSQGPVGWGSTASGEPESQSADAAGFNGDPFYLAPGGSTWQAIPAERVFGMNFSTGTAFSRQWFRKLLACVCWLHGSIHVGMRQTA